MDKDLCGARGALASLDTDARAYVGECVSQTVFRRADLNVLASFFEQQQSSMSTGEIDALAMLRYWGDRRRLTRHALSLLNEPTAAGLVRSALDAAYRSWDGTVPGTTGDGLRRCKATLVLRPSPCLSLGFRTTLDHIVRIQVGGQEVIVEPGATGWLPDSLLPGALRDFSHGLGLTATTRRAGRLKSRSAPGSRESGSRPGAPGSTITS